MIQIEFNSDPEYEFACSKFQSFGGDINKVRPWLDNNKKYVNVPYLLYWSAACGHLNVLLEFIKYGADVNSCNGSPLCWSIEKGCLDVVRELIKAGADINVQNSLPMRISIRYGHWKIARELFKAGVDIYYYLKIKYSLKTIKILITCMPYINKNKVNSNINFIRAQYYVHYSNIMNIIFDIPYELYDEIARFI